MEDGKKAINAWILFLLGPKAFSTAVDVAIFPIYFREVAVQIAAAPISSEDAAVYWKYLSLTALFLAAVLLPFLGSIADQLGKRKQLLVISNAIGIVATGTMIFIGPGDWILAIGLYLFGSVAISCVYLFYDSLLPHLASREELDQVSVRSTIMDYLGGAITLVLALVVVLVLFPGNPWGARIAFLVMAVWWAVVSMIILPRLPEPQSRSEYRPSGPNLFVKSIKGVFKSFRDVQTNLQLLIFLCAFGAYSGGISTIINMATVYGQELGIGTTELIGALVLNQVVGFSALWLYGRFVRQVGAKRMISAGLVIYTLVSVAAYFMVTTWMFWLLAVTVGIIQGGVMALNRSLLSKLIPQDRSAGFFGLFATANRFSAVIAPTIFGVLGQAFGTTRLAMLSTLILFLVGRILMGFLDDDQAAEESHKEAALATGQTTLEQAS